MNEHLYVIGSVMAKEKAEENRKQGKANIPYNWQHKYWFLLGPPLYLPVVFQLVSIIFTLRRGKLDVSTCSLTLFRLWCKVTTVLRLSRDLTL